MKIGAHQKEIRILTRFAVTKSAKKSKLLRLRLTELLPVNLHAISYLFRDKLLKQMLQRLLIFDCIQFPRERPE